MEEMREPVDIQASDWFTKVDAGDALPAAPPGPYVMRQYHSVYGGVKAVVETITLGREDDGAWRVVGYVIR